MKAARILLVDDEGEIVRLLTRRLTRLGHAVTAESGGDQALALLHRGAFDLAILDFMMPGMNGLKLAARCRAQDPDLKILILTGSPVVKEIEEAGYLWLPKPLENLQELDQTIERLLNPDSTRPKEGIGQ